MDVSGRSRVLQITPPMLVLGDADCLAFIGRAYAWLAWTGGGVRLAGDELVYLIRYT